MIKRVERGSTGLSAIGLQAPEVLETRQTPMFMCCGHWSYAISLSISGPTVTVTWTEDSEAACNLLAA